MLAYIALLSTDGIHLSARLSRELHDEHNVRNGISGQSYRC